jgi:hydrogenase large subunit
MACAINTDDASGLNAERLALVQKLLIQGKEFVEQVYIPDLLTIASFYKDWGAIGGFHNFMAFGDFPMEGYGNKDMSTLQNSVWCNFNKDLSKVHDVDLEDLKQ